MASKEQPQSSVSNASKYWDIDPNYEVNYTRVDSPVKTMQMSVFCGDVLSVYGSTDTGERPKGMANASYEEHQSSLQTLPIPSLQHTCELYLKSIQPIVSSEEYFFVTKQVEEFLKQGGAGEVLQNLLLKWQKTCGHPSWLEEFWDDSYLCTRDPIPLNVNYFFHLQSHKRKESDESCRVSQLGRAASLLHAAIEYYISIRDGTVEKEFERGAPVCMSQYRFVFATSRVPGLRRDRKINYSTAPLTSDLKKSTFSEYVAEDPTHCIVVIRNYFFKVDVLQNDGTQCSVDEIAMALKEIETIATSRKEAGAPVGLFTTLGRTDWFHTRERLKVLGNGDVLQAIQSAIICLCLDGAELASADEAAKIFLHGPGTNRWFDRHNIIVTRDGSAGINWEHSVADGGTTLRIADFMFRQDCERFITDDAINELFVSQNEMCQSAVKRVTELHWSLDKECDNLMKEAFADFKLLIESNETKVLHFKEFGGAYIKYEGMPPDAFVQLALQLTYYRLFGRNCATYEAASTRIFSHGRTECVRSATRASWDFCRASHDPIFSKRVGSYILTQRELMRIALESHTEYMKLAKKGYGVDRHFYGLRIMARMHKIPLPALFTDQTFYRSSTWLMSTSHCGSSALDAFGFGPVVTSGYGIGYMIKSNSIEFVITSKYTHPFTSASVFATMLHSSLMYMESIVKSEKVGSRASGHTLVFSHPCGFNDFEFSPEEGFVYGRFDKESLRGLAQKLHLEEERKTSK